jgi:hypothetical protein
MSVRSVKSVIRDLGLRARLFVFPMAEVEGCLHRDAGSLTSPTSLTTAILSWGSTACGLRDPHPPTPGGRRRQHW